MPYYKKLFIYLKANSIVLKKILLPAKADIAGCVTWLVRVSADFAVCCSGRCYSSRAVQYDSPVGGRKHTSKSHRQAALALAGASGVWRVPGRNRESWSCS